MNRLSSQGSSADDGVLRGTNARSSMFCENDAAERGSFAHVAYIIQSLLNFPAGHLSMSNSVRVSRFHTSLHATGFALKPGTSLGLGSRCPRLPTFPTPNSGGTNRDAIRSRGPPVSLNAEAVQTAQLLSQFAKLLNSSGPDSPEADAFLERYRENSEFVELARLSGYLKRALCSNTGPQHQLVVERL